MLHTGGSHFEALKVLGEVKPIDGSAMQEESQVCACACVCAYGFIRALCSGTQNQYVLADVYLYFYFFYWPIRYNIYLFT